MRDATDMPELREDDATLSVDRIGDLAPAIDLLVRVDAGRPRIALATRLDLGAFGHHETGAGALAVIVGHQLRRGIARLGGALAGQRRQHDAVCQLMATERDRAEVDLVVGHFVSPGARHTPPLLPLA